MRLQKRDGNAGNRQEEKLKKEIKELCQSIVGKSNKLFKMKERRKATKKEKEILKQLKAYMGKD